MFGCESYPETCHYISPHNLPSFPHIYSTTMISLSKIAEKNKKLNAMFCNRYFVALLLVYLAYHSSLIHLRSHLPKVDITSLNTTSFPEITNHIVESAKHYENSLIGNSLLLLVYMQPVIYPSWIRKEVLLKFGFHNLTGEYENPNLTVRLYHQPLWALGYQFHNDSFFLDPGVLNFDGCNPEVLHSGMSSSENKTFEDSGSLETFGVSGYERALQVVDLFYPGVTYPPELVSRVSRIRFIWNTIMSWVACVVLSLFCFSSFWFSNDLSPSDSAMNGVMDAIFIQCVVFIGLILWSMFESDSYYAYVGLSGAEERRECLWLLFMQFLACYQIAAQRFLSRVEPEHKIKQS